MGPVSKPACVLCATAKAEGDTRSPKALAAGDRTGRLSDGDNSY